MKRIVTISTLTAAALSLFSQEARIAILAPDDTVELKTSYEAYKAAENRFEKVSARVQNQYGAANWGQVQFSADFRAMVPLPPPAQNTRSWSPINTGISTISNRNETFVSAPYPPEPQ